MAQALSEAELLRLLDALADGEWHSGERLAGRAHISRAALAKRMDKLRDWQLDIEAQQGLGYRLSAPLERLDERKLSRFAPLPPGDRDPLSVARGEGLRVSVVAVTDSTNTQLLNADAADDPQALFAEFQTAGRGRRGRQWISPFAANLYFSLAWSFAQWPPQLTALPLAVGLTCARALRGLGVREAGIKWPNDLYVDGKKLGGILIEHRGEAGGSCRAVIGIGINVGMSAPQAAAVGQPWTCVNAHLPEPVLSERRPAAADLSPSPASAGEGGTTGGAGGGVRGRPPRCGGLSRNRLASVLLKDLHAALRRFQSEGFAPFAAQWREYDLTRDQPVRVLAEPPLQGIARGVDSSGALLLEHNGRRQLIHSGEVSLRLA